MLHFLPFKLLIVYIKLISQSEIAKIDFFCSKCKVYHIIGVNKNDVSKSHYADLRAYMK